MRAKIVRAKLNRYKFHRDCRRHHVYCNEGVKSCRWSFRSFPLCAIPLLQLGECCRWSCVDCGILTGLKGRRDPTADRRDGDWSNVFAKGSCSVAKRREQYEMLP